MPLLWLSLAFITGIALAPNLGFSQTHWLLLAGGAIFVPIARWFTVRLLSQIPQISHRISWQLPVWLVRVTQQLPHLPLPCWVLLASLTFGATRYLSALPDLDANGYIARYNDLKVGFIVEGIVIAPPDERDRYTNLRIQVERLHPEGEPLFTPVCGTLLARLPLGERWHYGDRVQLRGEIETPPTFEDFSYRDYLARQGIYAYMPTAWGDRIDKNQANSVLRRIYELREIALGVVYRLYADPEASLLAGILLGIETGIPEKVQAAFVDTGTAHIIAISGFNITVLSGLFTVIFIRLLGKGRRYLAAILSILVIALYTILVGAGAAVVRAAIMGGLALLGRQLGRRQTGLNSLGFVAAVMALFDPQVLWDVSFQLSFMATLGLVLYAEPLAASFQRFAGRIFSQQAAERVTGWVGEYFLFTIAAQVTTLPVILYHFQRLSLSSLIANPVILPAQPLVMVLGGLGVILGMVYPPLGQGMAYMAWPFVAFTIRAVEFFAKIPGGAIALGRVALPWVFAFYAILLVITYYSTKLRSWIAVRFETQPGAEAGSQVTAPTRVQVALLAGISILAILAWQGALATPDGRLHLYVLDVGSGDGLLIQTPEGRYLLVDGGPSTSRLSDALGRRLPPFQRKLDYLVVSATEDGQLGALPRVLERYPSQNVLWAGTTHGTYSARNLQKSFAEMGIDPIPALAGHRFELGSGSYLEVLSVGKRGAVLLLAWERFRALLPIGQDFTTLEELQNDPMLTPVTALLLAESGYAPVNPPEWIEKLRPQVVLLSVAADDRYGMPSLETLAALQGYTLLRTDRNGWIHLSTDGEKMWVEVEKR